MHDMTDHKQIKHSILILYILLGGALIFLISKTPVRSALYTLYTAYEETNTLAISGISSLPSDIQQQINEMQFYQFFKEHKYPEAIVTITGENSRSYYNLGTLKTLWAYNEALGSTLSGLQKARSLISDAYKDLDTAEKIQLDSTLSRYIQENKSLSQRLSAVIQVKTCYGEYNTALQGLQSFDAALDAAKSLLQKQKNMLTKNIPLQASCLENLKNINEASQKQLDQLQNQIQEHNKTYTSDFVDSIQDPTQCINQSMSDLSPTIDDAQKAINEFIQNHQNTLVALQTQDKETLKSLCDFAKNDANMNEQVDTALEKLMEQLQENLDQKKSGDSDHRLDQESNKQEQNNIQYKNVFEEDELQLLQKIDTNNKSLIQQIQDIKGEGRYNATKFINKLFEDFYGETGTLEKILQPSNTSSQR